ncbi:MAG: hypothetical protein E6J89_05120 [Deltaproteobacteria bacterium]|nr:MAG: hypothetical protein E6J89_05120 [Deltaproteobacteria bacterium]
MNKKVFLSLLAALILVSAHLANAQQPKKVPRIGFLFGVGDPSNPPPFVEAFRQGLRDLGYVEGKNIVVEYRYAEGDLDRISNLVAELVRLKVDVLVTPNVPAIRAAKQATKTIPIVMLTNVDPVATGIVDSLARPGGKYHGARQIHDRIKRKTAGIA